MYGGDHLGPCVVTTSSVDQEVSDSDRVARYVLASELGGNSILLPECPVSVLHVHSKHRGVVTYLGERERNKICINRISYKHPTMKCIQSLSRIKTQALILTNYFMFTLICRCIIVFIWNYITFHTALSNISHTKIAMCIETKNKNEVNKCRKQATKQTQ